MRRPLAATCLVSACTAMPPTAGEHPPSIAAAAAFAAPQIEIDGKPVQGGFLRGRAPAGTTQLLLDGNAVPIANDGGFFIAFPRDAPAAALLTAKTGDTMTNLTVAIAARRFPEERLPARLKAFADDPGFASRRAPELAMIAAARQGASNAQGWRGTWTLPAAGRISGTFGSQRFYGEDAQAPHSGVDIAAPPGTPVTAPAAGTVVLASPPEFSLEGRLVIIDHGLGLYASFLHLDSVDAVAGQRLWQGDRIGSIGATGRTTGPHLHWGVVWNGVRFDPLLLTGASANGGTTSQ